MSELKIDGFKLVVPRSGEKYGIENLKAVAVLAAKAGQLTASIVDDGRIDLFEAIAVFRLIRKTSTAAALIDWKQIKNELADLSGAEVETLADSINKALGSTITPPDVVSLISSVADAVTALIDVVGAAKDLKK
jgi:tRNA U34 5-carboxymethylaminomethyl modifying GTPase MnmE/TrmE